MIAQKIPLRHEQGDIGRLVRLLVKTEATGNEKGSKVANHPTFLSKVYQAVARSEVRGFCMASTAVCNEERTNPPQCDPQSHHFHRELPITHMGLIPTSRQVSHQNRGPPSFLFVCHVLTSSQPHRALLIRAVIDNSKCQLLN